MDSSVPESMLQPGANGSAFNKMVAEQYPPLQYSDGDRAEITTKIYALVKNSNHRIVFFEYHGPEDKYYFIHQGGKSISFLKKDAADSASKKAVEVFFSKFYSKGTQILFNEPITIIDAVYREVKTTSREVHDHRKIHEKAPFATTCYDGRLSSVNIVDDFIRMTFENIT